MSSVARLNDIPRVIEVQENNGVENSHWLSWPSRIRSLIEALSENGYCISQTRKANLRHTMCAYWSRCTIISQNPKDPSEEEFIVRISALDDHIRDSVSVLAAGMDRLRKINLANGDYHTSFLLLCFGYELFMKAIICVGHYKESNNFPTKTTLRDYGHDLMRMKSKIADDYTSDNFFQRTLAGKEHLVLLTTDTRVDKLLSILARFSNPADSRYYRLDVVTAKNPIQKNRELSATGEWIEEEPSDFKRQLGPDYIQHFSEMPNKDIYGQYIIPSIDEKLTGLNRALAEVLVRQGDISRYFRNAVSDFRRPSANS